MVVCWWTGQEGLAAVDVEPAWAAQLLLTAGHAVCRPRRSTADIK